MTGGTEEEKTEGKMGERARGRKEEREGKREGKIGREGGKAGTRAA